MAIPREPYTTSQENDDKPSQHHVKISTTRLGALDSTSLVVRTKADQPPNESPTNITKQSLRLVSSHGPGSSLDLKHVVSNSVERQGPVQQQSQKYAINGETTANLDCQYFGQPNESSRSTIKGKEKRSDESAGVEVHSPLLFASVVPAHYKSTDSRNARTLKRGSLQHSISCRENQGTQNPSPLSKPAFITWNDCSYQLLGSSAAHHVVEGNEHRTNVVTRDAQLPSTVDRGLVRNFSYPFSASSWNQRVASNERNSLHSSVQSATKQLTNGTVARSPTRSASEHRGDHTLPSGFPSMEEIRDTDRVLSEAHEILSHPSRASSTSPNTLERSHRGTIAIQAKLIKDLHVIIEKQASRVTKFEEHTIPEMTEWLEEQAADIELLSEDINALKDQNATLKIALDFGNKVLGGCFSREWSLWRLVDDLQVKQRGRLRNIARWVFRKKMFPSDEALRKGLFPAGFQWEVFGHGPDPAGSEHVPAHVLRANGSGQELTSGDESNTLSRQKAGKILLKKNELEAVVSCAKLNIKILDEDLTEMVALVRGCTMKPTGIQEMNGGHGGQS